MARETQAQKIAKAAAEVWMTPADEADELALVSKILTQAFLPHSDPKKPGWVRTNGNFTLSLKSGYQVGEDGEASFVGLPYGSIPRILLAWLNNEAHKNSQKELLDNPRIIYLGRSLSEFLEKLGIERTGGKRGGITRFKNQAERLFRSQISVKYTDHKSVAETNIQVTDSMFYFWDNETPEQTSIWENQIELSDRFYQLLLKNPVPLDWRILKSLKRSPMALDLYMWLTHRMSYLKKPSSIRWETLQKQIGADIEDIYKFRQQVRKHLKKIAVVWRELDVDVSKTDFVTLNPSSPLLAQTKMLSQ